jgi:hypothetical protein
MDQEGTSILACRLARVGRLVLIAGVVAGALALGAAGCGGGGEAATQAAREELLRDLDSCEPESLPVRVNLHNSGITCGAAIAMVILMPEVRGGSQTTESEQFGKWVCTDLRPARSPVLTKCRQGEKFFTFESA